MTQDYSDIADKILQKYEKNIFYLPQKYIGHFFERAYRMTGDKKYVRILAQYFFINKVKILSDKWSILNEHLTHNKPILLSGNHPTKNPRQIARYELYNETPALSFFDSLLLNMYFVSSVGLSSSYLKNPCDKILHSLESIDFEKLYLQENVMLKIGSFAINSIFFLDYLQLDKANLKSRMVRLIKEYYLDNDLVLKKSLDRWEYYTFIYNLTHIIIADSLFYERSTNNYLWITKYFSENIDVIIKNTTIDILAEVGLCIKLTQQESIYENIVTTIKKHIIENYDLNDALKKNNIADKEHTNSIIMLLFSNNSSWNTGPDLSGQKDVFNNLTL